MVEAACSRADYLALMPVIEGAGGVVTVGRGDR